MDIKNQVRHRTKKCERGGNIVFAFLNPATSSFPDFLFLLATAVAVLLTDSCREREPYERRRGHGGFVLSEAKLCRKSGPHLEPPMPLGEHARAAGHSEGAHRPCRPPPCPPGDAVRPCFTPNGMDLHRAQGN